MSLESASNARLDQQSGQERTARRIELLYNNARKLLEANRFDVREFLSLYKQATLDDHRSAMATKERIHRSYQRHSPEKVRAMEMTDKFALICEATFLRGIKDERWLGENAHVHATVPYDDLENGVDLAVEFSKPDGSSYLGLAVDVTFAGNLDEKFERIKRDIDGGQLSKIKYFKSADGSFRGELSMVPRVVVGVDSRRMEQIINRWNDDSRNPLQEPLVHDGFLEEIRMQLSVFRKYAESLGQGAVAQAYARDLAAIEQIIKEQPLSSTVAELSQDRVFSAIRQNLERFKKTVEK